MSIPSTPITRQLLEAIKQDWRIESNFDRQIRPVWYDFVVKDETRRERIKENEAIEWANQALHSLRVTDYLVQRYPECELSQRKFQIAVLDEFIKKIQQLVIENAYFFTDPLYYSRAYCNVILGDLSQAGKDIERVHSEAPIYFSFRIHLQNLEIESSLSDLERKTYKFLAKTKHLSTQEITFDRECILQWNEADMKELWRSHRPLCQRLLYRLRELLACTSLHQFNQESFKGDISDLDIKILTLAACEPAADAGNPIAQFALGYCFKEGIGREIDKSRCLKLWSASAAQNETLALLALGKLYFFGDGVEKKDDSTAFEFFSLAAKRNDIRSIMALGLCYKIGIGVPQNNYMAMHHFKIAADRGCPIAQKYVEELAQEM